MLQFSFGHQEKSIKELESLMPHWYWWFHPCAGEAGLISWAVPSCFYQDTPLPSHHHQKLKSSGWTGLGLSPGEVPAFSPSQRHGCVVSRAWLLGCCHIQLGGVWRLTGVCPTICHTNNSASGVKYYKSFFSRIETFYRLCHFHYSISD